MTTEKYNYFRRHIALPGDHGAWVFILSPLLIGLFAGGRFTSVSWYLVVAAMAAFLIRQPITIAIKAISGRRSRRELPAAWLWITIYACLCLIHVIALAWRGYGYLIYLALPGVPVFIWHLVLVSKRSERRQVGIEVVGSGVLALAAPAAYWVGVGRAEPLGWLLFAFTWFQSAASIVYAYLRLEQRVLEEKPDLSGRLRMGQRALLYTTFNILVITALSIFNVIPPWLPLPYAIQWIETIWGTLNPAIGVKPTAIGFRQLGVSTLFTVLFILTWKP